MRVKSLSCARREYRNLSRRWACQTATRKEIMRCMELARTLRLQEKANVVERAK